MSSASSKQSPSSVYATNLKDEGEVLRLVNNIWSTRPYHKYPLESQWYENIAWYLGNQNLIWSDALKTLTTGKFPSWKVNLIVNHLQPMIRTLHAKIYKANPEWDTVPATHTTEDIQIAQLSRNVLHHVWNNAEVADETFEMLLWVLTTGTGFLKIYWDAECGPPVITPGEDGEFEFDDLNIGDVKIIERSPFNIIPDHRAVDMKDCRYLLDSTVMDSYEVADTWNVPVDQLRTSDSATTAFNFTLLDKIRNLRPTNDGRIIASNLSAEQENKTILHELWIKPKRGSKKYKDGRHIIVAGNKVLKNEPFPYKHGMLPYIMLKEVHVPGRFWGTCTLEQLRPIQAEYNKTKSQIVENRNMMGKPKYLVPKGSGIGEDSLTSEPGEIVNYRLGFKPEVMPAAPLPSSTANMLAQDRKDMEDISGIHEASRAEAPGQVRSGRGIIALIEQDETRPSQVVGELEKRQAIAGRMVLNLMSQFAREERIARITGENNEVIYFSYTGKSFVGPNSIFPGADYFDVRVVTRTGLPMSPTAQLALLDNLLERQVLNPQKDRDLILKMVNIGRVQDVLDDSRLHRSKQLEEIQMILDTQGRQELPVEDWHDHQTHLDVLNQFRNSISYGDLPEDTRNMFDLHAQRHEQAMAIAAVKPEIMTQQAAQLMTARMQQQLGPLAQQPQLQGQQ
jgi:hypothetical protein